MSSALEIPVALALDNFEYDIDILDLHTGLSGLTNSELLIFILSYGSLAELVVSADGIGRLSQLDERRYRNIMRRILNLKINLIPEVSLDEDQEYSLEMCTICHGDFGDWASTRVVKLVCGHYFHLTCLKMWLEQWNQNCPLCRALVKLGDYLEYDVGGHNSSNIGHHGLRSTCLACLYG